MIDKISLLAASLCVALLGGCGGGGGNDSGGGNTSIPPVVSGPVQSVPNSSYGDGKKIEAFQRINEWRRLMGLGLLAQNSKADAAAQAHANYLAQNGVSLGHREDPTKPGFTGYDPGSRLLAAGYDYSAGSEVLAGAQLSPSEHVDGYMNTVYHRIPFIQYNYIDVGVGIESYPNGSAGIYSVIELGIPAGSGGQESPSVPYVVFPLRNATILRGSIDPEIPSPPGAGYPVSISFDPRKSVATTKFELREAGTTLVPTILLTANTDSLVPSSMAFLSPTNILRSSSSFTALWEGTVDGTPLSVTWGFSTK